MKTTSKAGALALMCAVMLMGGCAGNNGSGTTIGSVTGSGATATPHPSSTAGAVAGGPGASGYGSDSIASAYQPASTAYGAAQAKDKISLTRNFYFVFDGSGSMKDAPRGGVEADRAGRSKIAGAKWAVHKFLEKVPDDVNLGLYVFDRLGKRELLPLGPNNRQAFLSKVDSVVAGGGTPLGAAIAQGADALDRQYHKQLGYGEYRLIVITDGEATDALSTGVNEAGRKHIPIYTIGFDMGQQHSLRKHSLSYRSAGSASEVEQALEEAGAELDVFDPTHFQTQHASQGKKQT